MGKWHIGETCETCGGRVMKIMWAMPTECGAASYDRDGQLVDVGTGW